MISLKTFLAVIINILFCTYPNSCVEHQAAAPYYGAASYAPTGGAASYAPTGVAGHQAAASYGQSYGHQAAASYAPTGVAGGYQSPTYAPTGASYGTGYQAAASNGQSYAGQEGVQQAASYGTNGGTDQVGVQQTASNGQSYGAGGYQSPASNGQSYVAGQEGVQQAASNGHSYGAAAVDAHGQSNAADQAGGQKTGHLYGSGPDEKRDQQVLVGELTKDGLGTKAKGEGLQYSLPAGVQSKWNDTKLNDIKWHGTTPAPAPKDSSNTTVTRVIISETPLPGGSSVVMGDGTMIVPKGSGN